MSDLRRRMVELEHLTVAPSALLPPSTDIARRLGQASFETKKSEAYARFNMPVKDTHVHPVEVHPELCVIPFPVVHFVEPFRTREYENGPVAAEGFYEFVIWEDGDQLHLASRLHYPSPKGSPNDKPLTIYTPTGTEWDEATHDQALILLSHFNALLRRRDHGFIEQVVSRQVRRAEGYRSTYRDYVIVSAAEPHFKYATPIRRLTKTLRDLHAVRGHLRRYWNGVLLERPIRVRPHTRGRGDALQVKDYEVRT